VFEEVQKTFELMLRFSTCWRRPRTALVVIAVVIAWASAPGAASDVLRWGEPPSGLQMAVVVEPQAGFVHGWIRNGAISHMTVNNYFLGYFQRLHVEVRAATGWQRLDRAANGMRALAGAGPGKSNIELLGPNQTMRGARLGDRAAGRAFADLPVLADLASSFGLDLGDFQWPDGTLSQDKITIRVVQELSGPGLDGPVVVCSLPIELGALQFREVLDKLHDGVIYNRDFQDHPPRRVPASAPLGGEVIFAHDFPSGRSVRLEKAVMTQPDEEDRFGPRAHTYSCYTLMTAKSDATEVVVWMKRSPVSYSQSKRRAGIVPFQAIEHEGWISFLYSYFSELCLDTFRIASDGKPERGARQGLGIFPLGPSDKAVGFQRDGKDLKVAFSRSPDNFPRSDFVFTLKEGKPGWFQLPAKKNLTKERADSRRN
jgi:hypothetical protein